MPLVGQHLLVEDLSWAQIRPTVATINPTLTQLIDQLDPGPELRLFRASYPFGSHVIKQGVLLLPANGHCVLPLSHDIVSDAIRQQLQYSQIPVGLWLNTMGEAYIETASQVLPLRLFSPGSLFGFMNPPNPMYPVFFHRIWNIAVGARSLFILPKITDSSGLSRLEKTFGIRCAAPRSLADHIHLFHNLARREPAAQQWSSQILLFGANWFKKRTDDVHWLQFRHYLLRNEQFASFNFLNKTALDLTGQTLTAKNLVHQLKSRAYLLDTVMHLIALGTGVNLGFEPADLSEQWGPVPFIQKALVDVYGLKSYLPTLMRPNYLHYQNLHSSNLENSYHLNNGSNDHHMNSLEAETPASPVQISNPICNSVYYSLQFPSVPTTTAQNYKHHSLLEDLRYMKRLLCSFLEQLESEDSSLYGMLQNIEYQFYHSEEDPQFEIAPACQLPQFDERLLPKSNVNPDFREFCSTSSFLRGCIRVQYKNCSKPAHTQH